MNVAQFIYDLTSVYYQTNKSRLHPDFLTDLVSRCAEIYAPKENSLSAEEYRLYLKACVTALSGLTAKIHPSCLEQPPITTVFSTAHKLRDFILDTGGNFQPNQQEAFEAFREPFRDKHLRDTFGWRHMSPTASLSYPTLDGFEKADLRRHDADMRRYEKEAAKLWKETPPFPGVMAGTPFYLSTDWLSDIDIKLPLTIPPQTWFSSCWICAPQGKGKTNLLHNLIKDRQPHGTVFIMDAKGELINPYRNEAILIEPSLTEPPQINPLDLDSSVHAVELLEYLFSALLEARMTPKQSTLFSGVLSLLVTIPNATVETLRQVLQTGWQPYESYVNALPPRDRDFFTEGSFDSKGYSTTKEEVLWRLQLLLRNPYMAAMLEVPKTALNFTELLDSGKLIIVDNNPDILGDLGAEFFGRFILALVWNAVRARANTPGEKKPVYFFIDEAQTVISRDDNIPKLIHQCRSQNVALIFAHQELQQMKSDDVKGALANCAIRLSAPDGEIPALAPRLRTTPEFLSALPPYHFAACIRDRPTVAVTVPPLKLHGVPRRPEPKLTSLSRETPLVHSTPEEIG